MDYIRVPDHNITARLGSMTTGADPLDNGATPQDIINHINSLPEMATFLTERCEFIDAISTCVCEDTLAALSEKRKFLTDKIRARRQQYA